MLILSESEYLPSEKNTVTIVVTERTGHEVLLLQRNPDAYPGHVDPFPNTWELIGGGVDAGEAPRAAALRETREETGIVLPSLELVGISPFLLRGLPANNWIYVALIEKKLPVVLSQEHLAYAWQPLRTALHMQLAFKHSCILESPLLMRWFWAL